jgi:hypothetical protein
MKTRDYEAQGREFLTRLGLTFKAAFKGDRCPPWEDGQCIHGDRYRVTIKRTAALADRPDSVSFDFWNSKRDMQDGKEPTPYDVLACISQDVLCPETFEDFCRDYGFDTDSRKAEATFRRVRGLARKLQAFFTPEEIEALQEIR